MVSVSNLSKMTFALISAIWLRAQEDPGQRQKSQGGLPCRRRSPIPFVRYSSSLSSLSLPSSLMRAVMRAVSISLPLMTKESPRGIPQGIPQGHNLDASHYPPIVLQRVHPELSDSGCTYSDRLLSVVCHVENRSLLFRGSAVYQSRLLSDAKRVSKRVSLCSLTSGLIDRATLPSGLLGTVWA